MKIKLNLIIDEKIIANSKRYAAKQNISISKLVEELLKETVNRKDIRIHKKSFVEKSAGTLRIRIPDIDEVKQKYLKKKYGY